jgi:hypothetical protein
VVTDMRTARSNQKQINIASMDVAWGTMLLEAFAGSRLQLHDQVCTQGQFRIRQDSRCP